VRARALAVAVLVLAATTILANRVLPGWAYPVCGVVSAALLLALARAAGVPFRDLGLDLRTWRRSVAVGLAGAAVVGAVFGIALAVPAFRVAFHDGRVGHPDTATLLWIVLLRIPLGTVLIEEIAFRGVLPALFGAGERWRWGPVLGASALFGLWHALPSLALTRNAAVRSALGGLPEWAVSAVAMLAAAVAGVVFLWCRYQGRGVLTTILIHLATNCGGILLAVSVVSVTDG
jgi:membrane protease YdiL (CAAX protease family)